MKLIHPTYGSEKVANLKWFAKKKTEAKAKKESFKSCSLKLLHDLKAG